MSKFAISTGPFVVGCLLISSLSSSWAQQSETQSDVVGISVAKPDPDNQFGQSLVMGRAVGVEVHLRIQNPQLVFLRLSEKDGEPESTLRLLTPEGKELEGEPGRMLSFGTEVSSDGHRVIFPISVASVPPAQVNQLKVKGTIVLVTASDPATADSALTIAQDSESKLGNVPIKLTAIEENPYGDTGLLITIESKQPMDSVSEVTFLDESGELIESSSGGSGSFGFGGNMTYSRGYHLKAKPKKVTLRAKYFKATQPLKVEIDLPVSLGLGN